LNSSPRNYQFQHQRIYYNAKARPNKHFNAFFQLARACEENGTRCFNCYQLHQSRSPFYM
ncbi:hypothetical protein BX666DRAFT_1860582, partial [Dichotomocladium elegans]